MRILPRDRLDIKSGQGTYSVDFMASVEEVVARILRGSSSFLIIDRKVEGLYADFFRGLQQKIPSLLLDATEDEKTLTGVTKVASWLQSNGATKASTGLAIGGGVIQDIVAFTCHLYYRGIPWIFVPTTLLAMSDSCIGAKCTINLNSFKNQLGCFHAPSKILLFSGFTRTLSDADLVSGYGEIFKLMLTSGEDDLEDFDRILSAEGFRNSRLDHFITRSLETKKVVIEADEYEKDRRRILNYGHTFGHALESLTSYAIPHGAAVAWGMELVNYLSMRRGLLKPAMHTRLSHLFETHFHVTAPPTLKAGELIRAIRRDKKASSEHVNLILLEFPGNLRVVKVPMDDELEQQVHEFLLWKRVQPT